MRLLALDRNDQLPLKAPVRVGGAQLAGFLVPRALQIAPSHQAPAAHVEDVGEVRFDGDLQDEADRVTGKADEVVVLVHALENGAVEAKADRALLEDDVVLRAIARPSQR